MITRHNPKFAYKLNWPPMYVDSQLPVDPGRNVGLSCTGQLKKIHMLWTSVCMYEYTYSYRLNIYVIKIYRLNIHI